MDKPRVRPGLVVFLHSLLGAFVLAVVFCIWVFYKDSRGVTDAGIAVILAPFIFLLSLALSLALGESALAISKRRGTPSRQRVLELAYAPPIILLLLIIVWGLI